MAKLRFDGEEFDSEPGESVLDALTRNGVEIPSSCKSGVCQACMIRCVDGQPPKKSQAPLRTSLQEQGYFLACQCPAEEPLALTLGELTPAFQDASIVRIDKLTERMTRLRLKLSVPLEASAGNFVSLRGPGDLSRSYSVADISDDGLSLELHVAHILGGAMSTWLCREISDGQPVQLRGPYGECKYREGKRDQSLLLIATGSGLAPVYGIAKDALAAGHIGPIHLYHGSSDTHGLYLGQELGELASEYENFHYHPCCDVVPKSASPKLREGRANDSAFADHQSLSGWQVVLCGHPEMVRLSKKFAYLGGASLGDIYADPFEVAAPTSAAPTS